MSFLGVTAYARHRGISLTSVQNAVSKGHIKKGPDGLIDVEQADIDWEKNVGQRRKARSPEADQRHGETAAATWANKAARATPIEPAPAAAAPAAPKQPELMPTFNQARATKEHYEAEMRKLDYLKKKGTLVESSEVEEEATRLYRTFRDAMLNIPNRIASQIATETDATLVHELLTNEIRLTLDNFAEDKQAAA